MNFSNSLGGSTSKQGLGFGSLQQRVLVALGLILCLAVLANPVLAQIDAMGAGAGWIDCNNDGYLDVCYLTPDGAIVFLVYNPKLERFMDVSETAIPAPIQNKGSGLGVVCGDVNNDGWADMFLSINGFNQLLLNNGNTTFTALGKSVGIGGEALSATAALWDYDMDGLLDIYVGNYQGAPNQLFHNEGLDGNGIPHFIDVAVDLGMDLARNGQSDWALGLAVGDYDNDGDPDLYVANDYNGMSGSGQGLEPGPNILYRNNGNGTFTDVSYEAGVADAGWAMGTAFGDYNGDGWLDLFVTNFWEDTLLRNNKDGTFSNVTRATGLVTDKPEQWHYNGWGTAFLDYDNDGDLDIHVTNGYITNGFGQVLNEPNELWENIGVGPNGHVQFIEVGARAGIADIGDGRGAAYGDLNRDGFVDIIVINNNYVSGPGVERAPLRLLYMNQGDGTFRDKGWSYGLRDEDPDATPVSPRGDYSANGWIEIHPRHAVGGNSSVYGTRVTVEAGGRTWIQDLGTGSYCSSSSPFLHFGLGGNQMVDRITARFPSGRVATLTNIPANWILTIPENMATPVRLLALDATQTSSGVMIRWRYVDDGDLTAFSVSRLMDGSETVLASYLKTDGGEGGFLDRNTPRQSVTYALDALYRDGSRERVGTVPFVWGTGPGIARGQNFPNPFASVTTIPVPAPPLGEGRVQVFDPRGRLVRILRATLPETGGTISWDGRDESGRAVPPGAYFYRVDGTEGSFKMIRRP